MKIVLGLILGAVVGYIAAFIISNSMAMPSQIFSILVTFGACLGTFVGAKMSTKR